MLCVKGAVKSVVIMVVKSVVIKVVKSVVIKVVKSVVIKVVQSVVIMVVKSVVIRVCIWALHAPQPGPICGLNPALLYFWPKPYTALLPKLNPILRYCLN